MRSITFTFLLAIMAAFVCGVGAWQWNHGGFDILFGKKPIPVGTRLFDSFDADDVKYIRVTMDGVKATFSLENGVWQASTPWIDRMDPRAAMAIINFTLGLRVEDHAGIDEMDLEKSGLAKSAVSIRLESSDHLPLAKYKIGRITPWKAEMDGIEKPVPTVFVLPSDKMRRNYIYSCTGDITPLFKGSLKFLRDHHPFNFSPGTLKQIRIRSQQGDLTLGRSHAKSPWRIIKPINLPTNPSAIKTLIEGLSDLQALKVSDSSEMTQVPNDKVVKTNQIALTFFESDEETLLEIFPPNTGESQVVKGIVNDRPRAVFELPLKPEQGIITLANLPLSVNELRDPTLTHIHIPSLRSISIESNSGPEIHITRQAGNPWMVMIDHVSTEVNEENLYSLLRVVTTGKSTGFVSDAATDFSPWGLDRPILQLRFLGEENQAIVLRFGVDAKGVYYVNRVGTPTVMRVDPLLVASISVRPYEWRNSRVWSLDRNNLVAIERKLSNSPPLLLKYTSFNEDSWKAESQGNDLTGSLDPMRVNYLFSTLEGLRASRWLSSSDESSSSALFSPSLTITVMENVMDDELNITGRSTRSVFFAPASKDAVPAFYFGRLNTDDHPFLISHETYQKLAIDLFEK